MIKPSKEFLEVFKKTEGALSTTESIAIMNIASESKDGFFLELGSYRGKSSLAIAFGMPQQKCSLILVEPEFVNPDWMEDVLMKVGYYVPYNSVSLYAEYSYDVIPIFNELSFVFIDSGSHQGGLPMQEVKLLEDRMVQSGIIAFHDFQSQFIEVEQAYNYLLSTGKYEPISIDWNSIIEYVRENDLEKGNLSWHHTEMEFPCFVGAVKRI